MNEERFSGYEQEDFLDEIGRVIGSDADNQIAKKLGVTRQSISNYRTGKRAMDDYCANQVANILRINPMVVIAAANEKREKSDARKDYWKELKIGLTSGAPLLYSAMILLISLSFWIPEKAEAGLNISNVTPYTLCVF